MDHVNEFPWHWTPAHVEEYFGDLRSIRHLSHSTLRAHQSALRHFTSYVANPDYGWDRVWTADGAVVGVWPAGRAMRVVTERGGVQAHSDPGMVEKFLRATIKGILYYTCNRKSAVSILARNVKTQDELAAKVYDLVKPALTPEGILSDDLQKRVMAPLLERISKRDVATGRFFDFTLARKLNAEIKAEGWKP